MGDRANFGFETNGQTIYLYGHWAGCHMLGNLAAALEKAEPRWDDESYAIRITISNLIGYVWESETGWGITVNELCDNEHSIPVVNFREGTVTLRDRDNETVKFTMPLGNFISRFALATV